MRNASVFKWLPVVLGLAAGVLCGCRPAPPGAQDEQREPHYLTGKARAAALDFRGAMEAFEAALEANPRNASAHYELGLLSERAENYAAAIHHLERFLKLRPGAPNARIIRDRINVNKMELARTHAFAPVTANLERDLQNLAAERQQLRAELEKARAEIAQWRAAASRAAASPPPRAAPAGSLEPAGGAASQRAPPATSAIAALPLRSHTVRSGETLTSIAARYSVTVQQLQAANPQVEPRRMRIGQILRVPPAGQ